MKRISYSLRLAIVGEKDSNKEIFNSYLEQIALESQIIDGLTEHFLIYKTIPIKIKVFIAEHLEDLLDYCTYDDTFEALLLVVNIYNMKILKEYRNTQFQEFKKALSFQGLTILTGIDTHSLDEREYNEEPRVLEFKLREKTKELNFIYCFEIKNKDEDLSELINTLLDESLFKFQYSSPDLYEHAKVYGTELLDRMDSNKDL